MKARRPAPRVRWFRSLRIVLLLWVLLIVAVAAWQDKRRSTRWREPLFVAVYPIAADSSTVTHSYVAALDSTRFADIGRFFSAQANGYHLKTDEPIRIRLQRSLDELPPQLAVGSGPLSTALWSLKLRYWAWVVTRHATEPQNIRIFVLYHDPELTPSVPHSLGLTKGLIGVVYAFASASMDGANDVVIAHELLHTVGATDKYDMRTDAPIYPEGYGDARQQPLYPQARAELMAGRRMLTATTWEQVSSLEEVAIGPTTALEIRWPQSGR